MSSLFKIDCINITGIKKPCLYLKGIKHNSNNKLEVFFDDNRIGINTKKRNVSISIPFSSNVKKILIYEINNEEKYLIATLRNSLTNRVVNKVASTTNRIIKNVEYTKNDSIDIQCAKICGIKNQELIVEGFFLKKNVLLEIYSKNKRINYELKQGKVANKFRIECSIPKNKNILIYVICKDNKFLSCKIKNCVLNRCLSRIKEIIKSTIFTTQFITNDFVGIQVVSIDGIINPKFHIHGSISNEDIQFIIKADEKTLDYQNIVLGNNLDFCLETKIPRGSDKIEVFCIENNETILVCRVFNRIIKRIIKKVKSLGWKIIIKLKVFFTVLYKGIKFAWKEYHFLVPPKLWRKYLTDFVSRMKGTNINFYVPENQNDYLKWIKENEKASNYIEQKYEPKISILIPVYNVDSRYLSECLDSILNQTYKNFEICLADDCSSNKETIQTLKKYEVLDNRIKVVYRNKNGHISEATNTALEIAVGEFIALVDNDDTLESNALAEFIYILNKNKKLDLIYSDEDKLDKYGKRCFPHFKPDYSPDTLLSLNYICHLTMIRKSLVEKVGAFEKGLEGAQDHDLLLKVVEKTSNIYHISKILYHWRMIEGSTATKIEHKTYALDKGKIAISNSLKRRGISGIVHKDERRNYYYIEYTYKKEPLISIIIPTKDHSDILETCLKSIINLTTYKNYEIIIVNNNSSEPETFSLFKKYTKQYKNIKVIDANIEFNYSKINNIAVSNSKGEYIVLLNNDTELITPNWLNIMVGYAMQKHIGAVGVKLLYPDTTIQHAGVVIGLGGVASHVYIYDKRNALRGYGRLSVPYNYSAVTAACLMISREKFEEVGRLEEDLKVAYNDIDFGLKLLKKGYYNIFLPQVELTHHESKSRGLDTSSEKYKRFLKEQQYMYDKWNIKNSEDKFYNPNFSYKGCFVLDKKKGMKK